MTFIRLVEAPTFFVIAVCIVIGALIILAGSTRLGIALIVSMLVLAGYRVLRGRDDSKP